jgi:ribosomal protein S18 acetylase RimI-like enzyme
MSHVLHLTNVSCRSTLSEEESEEDNKDEPVHGHVNSISVLRSYRRLGLAKKLMLRSRECILV